MRILFGIALGLLVVFNWASISAYFDTQIDQQAKEGAAQKAAAPTPEAPRAPVAEPPAPAKADPFKDFK